MKTAATVVLVWAIIGCTTIGCTTATTMPQTSLAAPTILVTLPLRDVGPTTSRNPFYQESAWRAPLYTRQLVRRLSKDYALNALDAWPIDSLDVHCVLFQPPPDSNVPSLLTMLSQDPRVNSAQLNAEFETMTRAPQANYDDPLFTAQYGAQAESVRRLHAVTTGAQSVIGMIDSGVDLTHPDLDGQVRVHTFVNPTGVEDQRHGTAMAGIVAARPGNGEGVVGMAPSAMVRVYGACRAAGARTLCRTFDLAKSIEHAIHDGVQILNISLAGPNDPLLSDLLQVAVKKHDMIIVAAENTQDPVHNFPAALSIVNGVSERLPLWFARPAQMSTRAGGGYRVFFGSSVASAGVSGMTALLRSTHTPTVTRELLRTLLLGECDHARLQKVLGPGLTPVDFCE